MERLETQRENRAKTLTRFFNTAKGIEVLEGRSVEEVFSDEKSVHALISVMSEKQFIELLNGLNGIIRSAKKEDWGMTKYQMEISGAMDSETAFTPSLEDRAALLSRLLSAAKEMNKGGRSMEDIALLVSVTINAIHPWEDANGRTSRLVYTLLAEGCASDFKERFSRLMSEEGSDELTTDARSLSGDLDHILRAEHYMEVSNLFSDIPTKEFRFVDGVADQQKDKLVRAFKAESFACLAIAVSDFLKDRGDAKAFIRDYPDGRSVILFDQLVSRLSSEEIVKILADRERIQRQKVELLIDCVNHPNKNKYRVKTNVGEEMSLLEKLRKQVKRDK